MINAALGPTGFGDRRSLLEVVTGLARTTQVVYLTDDPETPARTSQWAGGGQSTSASVDGIATVA